MPTRRGRNHDDAGFGRDAAAREHEAEAGVGGGQPDVHRQLHRHADADRRAVDGADHRLQAVEDAQGHHAAAVAVDAIDPVLVARRVLARGVVEGLAAGGQVGPGAKGPAGPGDDDGAHRVVGVGLVEHRDQLVAHACGEGVELVGPVQRDGGDAVVHAVEQGVQGGQGHAVSPSGWAGP
jgi:hypothetical protein